MVNNLLEFESKVKNFSFKYFLSIDSERTLAELDSSLKGLTISEAKKRLEIFGENKFGKEKSTNVLNIFLEQIKNPLIWILLIASLVSLYLGDFFDFLIILIMAFLSIALGFVEEYRSAKAVESLMKKIAPKAKVKRDNIVFKIPAADLVPGDIIEVSTGDIVPAEVRFIETNNLTIDESMITGESFAVEKDSKILSSEVTLPQDAINIGFMGTKVISGFGTGVVIALAKNSEIGKTAKYLESADAETEFQVGIRKLGKFLVFVTIGLTIIVFVANIFLRHGYLESFLFALALAIGITPEFLPAIITINLAKGAAQMSEYGVIVKKLATIENLGNINVLCTDKTGTLTEGKIKLVDFFDVKNNHNEEILEYVYLSSLRGEGPMDGAIKEYFEKYKKTKFKVRKVLDDFSFDFQRKIDSILVSDEKNNILIAKGAVDSILERSKFIDTNGKIESITKHKEAILKEIENYGSRGLRLLAVAYKKTKITKISPKDENDLAILGFLVFGDHLKETAKETIEKLDNLDVKIKILTGDNKYVCAYIAKEVGLDSNKMLSGDEISKMSSDELKKVVKDIDIFYRLTPEHKLSIIKALKNDGNVVGFLGDGANDAMSLKEADAGISVDSAADVARDSADIILTKKSLEILIEGVKSGRKIFGNTMKYIFNATSSNFGNMLSVATASFILPFLPMLPMQIIILNFLGDVPSISIASDNVDEEYLEKPKEWNIKAIAKFMFPFGAISSLFDFATFFLLFSFFKNNPIIFRSGWFVESLITEVLIIFVVRTKKIFFKSNPSKLLIINSLISLFIGLTLIFTPLNVFFNFTYIPAWFLGIILILVFIYLMMAEGLKYIFYRTTDIY